MRTKDELFRAAQREIATRRQRAVMQADSARRVAFAAHPELAAAEDARMRAGLPGWSSAVAIRQFWVHQVVQLHMGSSPLPIHQKCVLR